MAASIVSRRLWSGDGAVHRIDQMSIDARLEVVRLLSDGYWHSGEALAQSLGISRAAVWKRLQGLKTWGLPLHSVQGRGYRLPQAFELLDAEIIRAQLAPGNKKLLARVDIFPVIESTNAWLMAQPSLPQNQAHLCLAEFQSAGRGRRGRQWQSPFGANLYFSLAWCFDETPPQLGALSLAVGVTIAETLSALGAAEIGVKWPNDLLWRGRKLAGILLEHRGEGAGPARVVIGIGLNHAMTQEQAQSMGGINQPWTSLQEVMQASHANLPDRNVLAAKLSDTLVQTSQQFSDSGFRGFTDRWLALDLARGAQVTLEHDDQEIMGIAQGVDTDGALLLEIDGRQQRFLSGDLSLRLGGLKDVS